MDQLREEVLQAERTRSDLLKWKLGLAGTIGALGLGLAGSTNVTHAELALIVIPLVCVYVDLLCLHLTLRILVIGTFTREWNIQGHSDEDPITQYEAFAQHARELVVREGFVDAARRLWFHRRADHREMSAYALEDWALYLSTCVLSVAGIGYGVYLWTQGPWQEGILFILSGGIGLTVTVVGRVLYERRVAALLQPGIGS